MEQSDDAASLDELIIRVFVKVSVNLNLELGLDSGHVDFALRHISTRRISPIDLLGCDQTLPTGQII